MYQIISDGSCDLDDEILTEIGAIAVPFYVALKGDNHMKEGVDITKSDVYQFMVDNPKEFPRTSLPSMQDYINVFTPILEQEKSIICFCVSSKLSGSINSARLAKDILLEDYPEAIITVIDTTQATAGQGLIILEACKMQQAGYEYDQVVESIVECIESTKIFFTIDSTDYLVHGGRVGKLSGVAAGTLGLKPLVILEDGEINKGGVVRGRKVSKRKVIALLTDYLKDNELDPMDYEFVIGYGYDKNEGLVFRDMVIDTLQQVYPNHPFPMELIHIGATIAVHTGPSPIGIGMCKKFNA